MRRFREQGIDPIPGRQVELEGRPAVIRAVGAGRVQVDYNHPLAGRTLVYDVSVEKLLEDRTDKILSLISRKIPEVSRDKFNVRDDPRELTIEVPEEAFYLSGIQVAKKSITADLEKYFPKIETIAFREVYKRTSQTEAKTTEEPAPSTERATEARQLAPEEEENPAKKPPPRKTAGVGKKRTAKSKAETAEAE